MVDLVIGVQELFGGEQFLKGEVPDINAGKIRKKYKQMYSIGCIMLGVMIIGIEISIINITGYSTGIYFQFAKGEQCHQELKQM